MESPARRSPIKQKPLRQAGQYLDERIQTIMEDRVSGYLFVSAVMIFYAFMQWVAWTTKTPPRPILWTLEHIK